MKLATIISEEDEPAAVLLARTLGFAIHSPKRPTVHTISNKAPDLIVFDWAPSQIRANTTLLEEIRATAIGRHIPICILYSDERDVPRRLLSIDRVAAVEIPFTGDRFRRALSRLDPSLVSSDPASNSPPTESPAPAPKAQRVFIGHGHSPVWKDLKAFLTDRLKLDCVEFNAASAAGLATTERLADMLRDSTFAFIVLTAEDLHADGSLHARENAIHEVGLFQGRLGFRRAILLLEDGCQEFSNIVGLGQIRFPPHDLRPATEEIRAVLEREGMI